MHTDAPSSNDTISDCNHLALYLHVFVHGKCIIHAVRISRIALLLQYPSQVNQVRNVSPSAAIKTIVDMNYTWIVVFTSCCSGMTNISLLLHTVIMALASVYNLWLCFLRAILWFQYCKASQLHICITSVIWLPRLMCKKEKFLHSHFALPNIR